MDSSDSRYEGQPILRILECYVLWAIGELSEADVKTLTEMTPKLRAVYKMDGSWQEIIDALFELPPKMPEMIKEVWVENTAIAQKNEIELDPQEFAELFVDENFPA